MLANDTGRTTDTWTYDAWGETTSRTGVTENDYLYAGERFDRTTELYQLRARYLDPKTGTFLSLDPYQGNRHDPASLHKYMYANANPVNNVDPTGLTSIAEMGGAMAGQGILAGANGLNFAGRNEQFTVRPEYHGRHGGAELCTDISDDDGCGLCHSAFVFHRGYGDGFFHNA